MECKHDFETVEDINFSSEDFDKICMEIKGVKEARCAMKPGKINFINVKYRGYNLSFHPGDHEVYSFGDNMVCLDCGLKVKARDTLKAQLEKLFKDEYQKLKNRKSRKARAKKLWEKK